MPQKAVWMKQSEGRSRAQAQCLNHRVVIKLNDEEDDECLCIQTSKFHSTYFFFLKDEIQLEKYWNHRKKKLKFSCSKIKKQDVCFSYYFNSTLPQPDLPDLFPQGGPMLTRTVISSCLGENTHLFIPTPLKKC